MAEVRVVCISSSAIYSHSCSPSGTQADIFWRQIFPEKKNHNCVVGGKKQNKPVTGTPPLQALHEPCMNCFILPAWVRQARALVFSRKRPVVCTAASWLTLSTFIRFYCMSVAVGTSFAECELGSMQQNMAGTTMQPGPWLLQKDPGSEWCLFLSKLALQFGRLGGLPPIRAGLKAWRGQLSLGT